MHIENRVSALAIALVFAALLLSCTPQTGLAGHQDRKEPSHAPSAAVASEIEEILFALLNQERARHGKPRLKPDPQLQVIARQHSLYMARRRQLSHVNTLGDGPTERAEKAGILTVKRTGSSLRSGILENVGFMPLGNVKGHGLVRSSRDVALAMADEWMRSKAHRANMLSPDASVAGIGAASDGEGTFYLTMDLQ
jgi:uncharacterized protein YkwD